MRESMKRIFAEALEGGFKPYAYTSTEANAVIIRNERQKYHPDSNPSIGLLPDDSYVIWTRTQG